MSCKIATSSRRSPRILNQETEGTAKKTPDFETSLRPRVKRLTVKQIKDRKLLILETVKQANEEHAASKQIYLNKQEDESKKLPKKITFQNVLKLSNGEEKPVNFEDGNTAKGYMNLNGQSKSKAQPKKETSQKKRKAENKVEFNDDLQLKKVKMEEPQEVKVVISIPKTDVFNKKT